MRASLLPGAVFAGDYRIVRPLASGGMGSVYVAEQLSTARERALKIIRPDLLGNGDAARRFALEATIGARIESEHVVEVVGAGVDAATGAPWLAMELLRGADLGAHLEATGAMRPDLASQVFEQVAHAVGAAHDKGIIHRDLKPENLFLAEKKTARDGFIVKVLDFGIAKLVDEARTSATGALGSPLWMAPEQTEGGADTTPASDIWALGLIAFRMLTGKTYWASGDANEPSALRVLREIVMGPLTPPSLRSRELGGAPTPRAFDAWFAQSVVRDPRARFRDARQMAAALTASLQHVDAPMPFVTAYPQRPSVVATQLHARPSGASWTEPPNVLMPLARHEEIAPSQPPPRPASIGSTVLVPHVAVRSAVRSDIPPPPPTTVRPGRRNQHGTQIAAAAAGALVVALIALVALAGKSDTPSASSRRATDLGTATAHTPPKATATTTWRVDESAPEVEREAAPTSSSSPSSSPLSSSYASTWSPPPRATSTPKSEPAKRALGASCSSHDECGSGRCGANECVSVTVYDRMQRCNQGTNACFQRSTGIAACVDDAQASAGCYGGCNAARCQ